MNKLPHEVWTHAWWKTGEEGKPGKVAAFMYETVARTWAETWYGVSEGVKKEGKVAWQIRTPSVETFFVIVEYGHPEPVDDGDFGFKVRQNGASTNPWYILREHANGRVEYACTGTGRHRHFASKKKALQLVAKMNLPDTIVKELKR